MFTDKKCWLTFILSFIGLVLLAACTSGPAPVSTSVSTPRLATPTAAGPVPTTAAVAPSPQPTQASSLGANLIGKLEGPQIITDAAQFPKEFHEAPDLALLVKDGKLPPVSQRIGKDPLVIKPLNEVGKYGGVWRRGFTGPGDSVNANRCCAGFDSLIYWDYSMSKLVPNIAKDWKVSADGTSMDLFLRNGMKWSDGEPFTADDIMFWYQDMFLDDQFLPVKTPLMFIQGKPVTVQKLDDYSVRFNFPAPYFIFPALLAGATDLSGMARNGSSGVGLYAPKHYLLQFLPKYTGSDAASKKAKDGGFDNWVTFVKARNNWVLNPDLPMLTPWVTENPINKPAFTLKRNSYYFGVDTAGNQLPYLDRVVMTLAENLEVENLRAAAGEYDFQERNMDIAKLPVFLDNQQKGNYKVYLDPGNYGSDMIIVPNLSYDADAEIAKWIGNTDFRRALSLGIDRQAINQVFWLGTGVPGSSAPAPDSPYSPGTEYRALWATYDTSKASQLLDSIGLSKKDSDGFRLRTDGKGRLSLTISCAAAQFMPYARISQMIAEQWKKIGIELQVREMDRNLLFGNIIPANQHQLFAWTNDGSDGPLTAPWSRVIPNEAINDMGPLYGLWFATNGKQGKEPQGPLRDMMDMFSKAYFANEDERTSLLKQVWKIHIDQVFTIGIVGLSPASNGVRIVNVGLGNIPSRIYNSPNVWNPSIARPQTFYWKK